MTTLVAPTAGPGALPSDPVAQTVVNSVFDSAGQPGPTASDSA
jgi:hypothetical protein